MNTDDQFVFITHLLVASAAGVLDYDDMPPKAALLYYYKGIKALVKKNYKNLKAHGHTVISRNHLYSRMLR